jgi:acyl dehydratase
MPGRYYEDYEPGMVFRHEPSRTVTETDNLMFCALSMNPQPLHLDAEFAKTTEHGRQVVNGLFTVALTAGLSVFDTTLGTTAGNLAYTEMTHVAPVFIGDTLRSETTILSKRESKSRPDSGIVEFEHRGYNQHDALVMRIRRLGMIYKKPPEQAGA